MHFLLNEIIIMSVAIEKQCNLLDRELYPAVDEAIETALMNCSDQDSDPELQEHLFTVLRIRNEFESLSNFERKLVFNALIRAGQNNPTEKAAHPANIIELIRLIRYKDHKIEGYLSSLQPVSKGKYSCLKNLYELLSRLFTIEKIKLYDLVNQIVPLNSPVDFKNSAFNSN